MNKSLPVILFSSLFFFSASPALADQAATAKLDEYLQKNQSLKASFSQSVFDEKNQLLQSAKGELILQRPDKFYWHILQPDEQIILADGRNLWVYDVELEQATVENYQARVKDTPAELLSGNIKTISQLFDIDQLSDFDNSEWFRLTPVDQANASNFQWIELGFSSQQLRQMRFLDNLGQITEIAFSGVQLNPSISSNQFTLDLPDDVDVIGTPAR